MQGMVGLVHSDPLSFARGLRLPVIAAPMTGVSGLDLVAAATAAGVAASFPVHNAGGPEQLDRWLDKLEGAVVLPNLIVHRSNEHLARDVEIITSHAIPAV